MPCRIFLILRELVCLLYGGNQCGEEVVLGNNSAERAHRIEGGRYDRDS